jgi:outer membrane protein TolC
MANKSAKFIMIAIVCFFLFSPTLQARDEKILRIGIIIDGPWKRNIEYVTMIKSEILELTGSEFDVRFPKNKMIEGNWNVTRIRSAVSDLLADPDVDLVLTLGVIASHEIAKKANLTKPVIAPFVLDPKMQGIKIKEGASGIKNLNYIHTPFTSKNTIQDFQSVVEFKTMAYLINKSYLETIPALVENVQLLSKHMGINSYIFAVEQSVDEVLAKFSSNIEAVYVSPLLNLPDYEYDHLIKELKNRKLPSFSLLGTADVQQGFYMTNRLDIFPRVARRIALNIQRILIGDKPEKIPVHFDPGVQITINMETVREIDIYPKVDVLTEAELINQDQVERGQMLALEQAINGAVNANLDLMAKKKFVLAGEENIGIARSPLLPQLDLFGQGLMIDKDRAETSGGSQPERMVTGTLSATQLIYSEPVWANLSIQNSVQLTREAELNQLKLDIMLAAATAFFDVLRIKNFESIQKENLKRTKSNLEMARVRETVGSAGPAEVYRWESQLAQNRNEVIQVLAKKNIVRINLNRILHRKLNQRYSLLENNPYTDELSQEENVFKKYLSDLRTIDILPDFLVQEGLSNSPELEAIQYALEAQERALTSATNSFWAPTLALQADYTSILSRSGAGSEKISFIPNTSPADDKFWNVALNLSFPIFHGAERFATRRQSSDQLEQLRFEYDSVAEKIEQQIRSRLYIVTASFAAIAQTKLASEAANKSLKVVQDGYAQGMVSILDLLDAQNTALVSEELASNAVYDFIIDLMTAERAIGMLYIQMSDEDIEGLRSRLDAYLTER